jgi:hypothetical protein
MDNFSPSELPPEPPSNLKVRVEGKQVFLTWEGGKRSSGYKILRCKEEYRFKKTGESNCSFSAIGIAPGSLTAFVDNLEELGRYCYKVVAYNDGGESAFSNRVCVNIACKEFAAYTDLDYDGYASLFSSKDVIFCSSQENMPKGLTTWLGDCDDSDYSVNPSASELCDEKDNNCNGSVDEGCSCGGDMERICYSGPKETENIGECRQGIQRCEKGIWGKCEGQILPSTEVCDNLDNDCDGRIDEADYVIQFVRPLIRVKYGEIIMWKTIGAYFWDCERTNPDYPYGITTENTGILWTTKSENKFVRVPLVWEVKYYVINSPAELKELCKNSRLIPDPDIESYVDFSTQTILGFVVSTTASVTITGCDRAFYHYIGILKGMNDGTIYVGWAFSFWKPNFTCYLEVKPPYYDAVITNIKILPSSAFVMKYISNDFCPYAP